jgi:hypothetical protein
VTYSLGKVIGVEVYKQDAVVRREGWPNEVPKSRRREVKEFTEASRKRLAFVAQNTEVHFRNMITLTYPKEFPCDGKTVKGHLNRFLTWLRRDTGGCSYLWFLEFQARGAPHIHVLTDTPYPRRNADAYRRLRFRVSATWYRVVGSGDSKHLAAGTRTERIRKQDGAARYATKYAFKMKQKRVPEGYRNVGRFWGASRDVKPEPQGFVRCTEDDIRGAIEEWEYKPNDERPLYRVLYNQGDRFRDHLGD